MHSIFNLVRNTYCWVQTWKTWPCFLWIKAAEHYRSKKYQLAIHYYELGLKKYVDHPARNCALLDLAYCYFKLGEYQKAIKNLNSLLKYLPESKENYLRLAHMYSWIGNDAEAMWLLRHALKKFPNDMKVFYFFVFSLSEANAPYHLVQEGFDTLESFKAKNRFESDLLNSISAILTYISGDYEDGENALQRVVKLKGAPLAAKLTYARALIYKNKTKQARDVLNSALELFPDYPRTLSQLAKTYFDEGALDYALQLATRAAQNAGWQSPREAQLLAEIHHSLGDRASALMLAAKAQEINRKRSDAYLYNSQLNEFITSLASGSIS